MHYILSNECRVQTGKMEEFLRDVQQWEEAAMASPEAPEYHAVYLRRSDPSIALVITHFRSEEHAEAFADTGLLDNFHQRVMSCVSETSSSNGYDLYYGAGPAGPRVVFGEDARSGS
jgi:quinol monooxygenase YgiN